MNDEPDWKRMGWPRPPMTGKERKMLAEVVGAQRDYLRSLRGMVESIETPQQRERVIEILMDRLRRIRNVLDQGGLPNGFDHTAAVVERYLEQLRATQRLAGL